MPSAWKDLSSIASISAWIAPELLRRAEGEHLDLGELVDAVEPAAGPARGAGLGAEAVRQPDVLDRQRGLVEDLVGVHPAQGDLGGADQAQVGVLDRVDLRLARRAA